MAKRSVGLGGWVLAAVVFLCLCVYYRTANADVIFADSFGDDSCDGCAGGQEPLCTPDASGLNPPPANWNGIDAGTFTQLWAPQPVGNALVQIRMATGQFKVYTFNRSMIDPNRSLFSMNSDTSNIGPGARGAQYRYVAISSCPADFRLGVSGAIDPTLQPGCRAYPTEGAFLTLNFGPPMPGSCNLDPSRTYYMNVIFDDPFDGLNAADPCNPVYPNSLCAFRVQIQ